MKYLIFCFIFFSCSSKSFRDASRKSAHISPKPSELQQDIVQIFYARAFSWRGYFAVHPWIAWKKKDKLQYTISEVTAWNLRRQDSSISLRQDIPDRYWFDSRPHLLFEARGEKAAIIIAKVKKLIQDYPMKGRYSIYPGPNSNTYISYLIRNIAEIKTSLPPHAIGKDFFASPIKLTSSPSQTGFQFSAYGLLGLTLGLEEGIELNIIGLNFGIDFWPLALKLPFAGRIGFSESSFTD